MIDAATGSDACAGPLRIALHGANGRMGRSLASLILAEPGLSLTGACDRTGVGVDFGVLLGQAPLGVVVTQELSAGLADAEVVIDFSLPAGTVQVLRHCREHGLAAVVGTTGLQAAEQAELSACAARAPVMYAQNYSVGVNVLWALARQAVRWVGDGYDLEVVEMHHRHKVDAPSGTAVRLLEVVSEARANSPTLVHGRVGQVGARKPGEIGVHALRGGGVVGDHTLVLAGSGETLELSHRAQRREIFAEGALRAARWLSGRNPGLYSMSDVLGIG